MDATANAREQISLASKIVRRIDADEPIDIDDIDRLASLVISLAEWLASDGFYPDREHLAIARCREEKREEKR